MSKVTIYKIQNVVDGKVYVGSTWDLKNRWKCHRTNLRNGVHHSRHLQYAWNLYGEESFELSVLSRCRSADRVPTEQYWMDKYRCYEQDRGYNMARHAESCLGRKHSEETKRKISEAHKGRIKTPEHCRNLSIGQLGRVTSDETRRKLSASLKGRIVSEETIRKIQESRRGYTHSKETREKIAASKLGKSPSIETRIKLSKAGQGRKWTASQREKMKNRVPHKLTDESRVRLSRSRGGRPFYVEDRRGFSKQYETLSDAAKELGLDQSNIHKCLLGKAHQTKGYYCRYCDHP